jgi:hypothetical protein
MLHTEADNGRARFTISQNPLSVAHDYQAALLELDPEKLPQRVEAAETAIFKRLQTISQGSDSKAERQVIEDALANLRVLTHPKTGQTWSLQNRPK